MGLRTPAPWNVSVRCGPGSRLPREGIQPTPVGQAVPGRGCVRDGQWRLSSRRTDRSSPARSFRDGALAQNLPIAMRAFPVPFAATEGDADPSAVLAEKSSAASEHAVCGMLSARAVISVADEGA